MNQNIRERALQEFCPVCEARPDQKCFAWNRIWDERSSPERHVNRPHTARVKRAKERQR